MYYLFRWDSLVRTCYMAVEGHFSFTFWTCGKFTFLFNSYIRTWRNFSLYPGSALVWVLADGGFLPSGVSCILATALVCVVGERCVSSKSWLQLYVKSSPCPGFRLAIWFRWESVCLPLPVVVLSLTKNMYKDFVNSTYLCQSYDVRHIKFYTAQKFYINLNFYTFSAAWSSVDFCDDSNSIYCLFHSATQIVAIFFQSGNVICTSFILLV